MEMSSVILLLCSSAAVQGYWTTEVPTVSDLSSEGVLPTKTPAPKILVPPAVTEVNVRTRSETHIELEWTKVNNINTYILKSSDGTETPITASDGNKVTHRVSSLYAGTKYSFTLFTVLEELRSTGYEFSAVTVPPAVTQVNVRTRSETHIELEWNKVISILHTYILILDGKETPIPGSDGDKVTHTVSSLSAGTRYSFTLFTVFEEVKSTGFVFSAVTVPPAVTEVNVRTRSENDIELEWTQVYNIYTYILKSSDETETPITGSAGNKVTHTVSSLSAGTEYSFSLFTVLEELRSTGYEFSAVTADHSSCRYNCGLNPGSCSCSSSCQRYGNCCHDYYDYCYANITDIRLVGGNSSCSGRVEVHVHGTWGTVCDYNWDIPDAEVVCRQMGCGPALSAPGYAHFGPGSGQIWLNEVRCSGHESSLSQCYHIGHGNHNCGHQDDAGVVCQAGYDSCRYNCGYNVGSCSCTSSCHYYGNCCHDYNDYCSTTTSPDISETTTGHTSCRYNCGYNFGSCSCTSSCQRYGNCCHDYNDYCYSTSTAEPATTNVNPQCGGYLSGSGSFSSPYYPNYYHENAYCVWRLSAPSGQRILLTFSDLELERCCDCDYITVYDGPSVYYSQLGQLCHNSSLDTFHSSSSDMTVVFRSDREGVSRGFRAEFISSLPTDKGRVECSSDNMNIVISRSFLSSQGYSGHDVYINDEHCRPTINNYQVVFNFPLNRCGTVREFERGRVIYQNAVRGHGSSSGEITRQSGFKLSVACHMEKDSVSQIMYEASETSNFNITGTGRFNTTMAFFTSGSFYQQIYESPYKVSLNEYMYVQVSLRRDDSSLVLFLDTCVASPNPHDYADYRAYYLLVNGCPRDNTFSTHVSGSRSYARFSFQAFKFLRTHSSVYLQCKVLICPANDYNSRCRQGCRTRKTRSLGSQHQMATMVLGPITLKDVEKSAVEKLEDKVAKVDA